MFRGGLCYDPLFAGLVVCIMHLASFCSAMQSATSAMCYATHHPASSVQLTEYADFTIVNFDKKIYGPNKYFK